MKKILCVLPVEQRHKDKLEKSAVGCSFTYTPPDEVTPEQAAEANIIIGCIDPKLINTSPKLELLQLNSAGADNYISPGILAKNTILTNASGAYSQAVAEHALGCLIMLEKKLHLYRDAQRKSLWTDFGTVGTISGSTVLIVGLGDIGCHFARLVKALGAYVIGVKRRPSARPDCVDELYTQNELKNVIGRADVIFSILPGTGTTYHLYTEEYFELMKTSAIFINCGRGGAVASNVLYKALTSGQIAAAAVDVTEPEPLPAEDPLWNLENLIITPHISGHYHLPETFERIVEIASDNLGRLLSGEELRNVVDFNTGYRR